MPVTAASPAAMADDDCGCGRDYSDGMMSETFYPMNHVTWGNDAATLTPVGYLDKETQSGTMFEDRSTSVSDLHATISVNPSSTDSGFGEHAPLASASSLGGATRESSTSVTDDASHEAGKQAATVVPYSDARSTPSPDRERYNLEDEIVHLSEEPLTEDDREDRGVITSQDGVPRIDTFDGVATSSSQGSEDNCAVDCLYYTLRCCDCRII